MDFEPIVTRREPPPLPPPFRCVICQTTRIPDRWCGYEEKPPVCDQCSRHWGAGFGCNVQGCTRGERRDMQRLASLISSINWEIKNGHRRAR